LRAQFSETKRLDLWKKTLEKDCFQQQKESCERERGGNKRKKEQTSRGVGKLTESEKGHKNECKVETAKTTQQPKKKRKKKKKEGVGGLGGGVSKTEHEKQKSKQRRVTDFQHLIR